MTEQRTEPVNPDQTTGQDDSIRYYAELDAATRAFAEPWWCPNETFGTPGRSSLSAIPIWSVWLRHRANRPSS